MIMSFRRRWGNLVKDGALPASKTAMEAMPTVRVTEEEDCVICLTGYGVAGEAKEMPCKHRYHSDCIMKWLSIHGSCPVCRYKMPTEEEEKRQRRSVRRRVMITRTNRGRDSSTEDMDIDWNDSDSMDID